MVGLLRFLAQRLRTRPRLGLLALQLIPDLRRTIHVRGIGPVRLRLRKNRSLWLRDFLEMEAFPLSMLSALAQRDGVVYDVGANLGLYARFLAQRVGARVVAFEPVHENVLLLEENLELGEIGRQVTVVPVAIGDVDGEVDFQIDDMQSASGTLSRVTGGRASLGRRMLNLPPLTRSVGCRRLVTAITEYGLPHPDVIKIDVEGAEALVLDGAAEWLDEHKPKLVIELHGPEPAAAVGGTLLAMGYALRGKVDTRFAVSGYGNVDEATLKDLRGPYDLHYLVAVRDSTMLPSSWPPLDLL
jgi:FkbM family methyltransferase